MTMQASTPQGGTIAQQPVIRSVRPRFDVEGFDFPSGKAKRRLYGCFHRPGGAPERDCAVLLVPPLGQEYVRCHRALRQLALRLSTLGFPVLRFDTTGSGDSSGESEAIRLDLLLEDVTAAVKAARSRARKIRLCLFGLRLGGTLAALHAGVRGDLDSLILWNPILDGTAYAAEMSALHAAHEMKYGAAAQPEYINEKGTPCVEWSGFGYARDFVNELAAMRPAEFAKTPARQILLIDSSEEAAMNALHERLSSCPALEFLRLETQRFWLAEPYEAVVPHAGLQATIEWLKKVYA